MTPELVTLLFQYMIMTNLGLLPILLALHITIGLIFNRHG